MTHQVEIVEEHVDPNVEVRLEWNTEGTPALVVNMNHQGSVICVDPGLSERQVGLALSQLGSIGESALAAWRRLLGFDQGA